MTDQLALFGQPRVVPMMSKDKHYFFSVGPQQDFVLYNFDGTNLSDEEVTGADLSAVTITGMQDLQSQAWSCDVPFFFVIVEDGIYLMTWHSNEGWFCKKKSYKFIKMYLEERQLA